MDWEYPAARDSKNDNDREMFTKLVFELKKAFEPYNFLLTAAIAAGKENIDKAYEIDKIAK